MNPYQYHGQTQVNNNEYFRIKCFENTEFCELSDLLIITLDSLILFSVFLCCIRFLAYLTRPSQNPVPFGLGERMKYYEEQSRKLEVIPNDRPFIVRLDGRAFSNFTRKYKKIAKDTLDLPYSKEFKHAMLLTANDLLHEFNCTTAYTHSDEITLIFNNINPESQYIFDGKVYKLLSLIPSFACGSFMLHFSEELINSGIQSEENKENKENSKCDKLIKKLLEPNNIDSIPTFDARIIVFPKEKEYEIVNHMIWRSKGDCIRNFISLYAETYLGKKNILGMSNVERLEKLKEKGYDLNGENIDYSLKYGTFLKYNTKSNQVEFYVFKQISFTSYMYNFLTKKQDYELDKEQESNLSMLLYNYDNYGELFDF